MKKNKIYLLTFTLAAVLLSSQQAYADGNFSIFEQCTSSRWGVTTKAMFWVHIKGHTKIFKWDAKYYAWGSGARISSNGKAELKTRTGPGYSLKHHNKSMKTRYRNWSAQKTDMPVDLNTHYIKLYHHHKLWQGSSTANMWCGVYHGK